MAPSADSFDPLDDFVLEAILRMALETEPDEEEAAEAPREEGGGAMGYWRGSKGKWKTYLSTKPTRDRAERSAVLAQVCTRWRRVLNTSRESLKAGIGASPFYPSDLKAHLTQCPGVSHVSLHGPSLPRVGSACMVSLSSIPSSLHTLHLEYPSGDYTLPKSICLLEKLQELRCLSSKCGAVWLVHSLNSLLNLTSLAMDSVRWAPGKPPLFPPRLRALHLSFQSGKTEPLPPQIGDLTGLVNLSLQGFQAQPAPSSFIQLQQLTALSICGSLDLFHVLDCLGSVTAMRRLRLRHVDPESDWPTVPLPSTLLRGTMVGLQELELFLGLRPDDMRHAAASLSVLPALDKISLHLDGSFTAAAESEECVAGVLQNLGDKRAAVKELTLLNFEALPVNKATWTPLTGVTGICLCFCEDLPDTVTSSLPALQDVTLLDCWELGGLDCVAGEAPHTPHSDCNGMTLDSPRVRRLEVRDTAAPYPLFPGNVSRIASLAEADLQLSACEVVTSQMQQLTGMRRLSLHWTSDPRDVRTANPCKAVLSIPRLVEVRLQNSSTHEWAWEPEGEGDPACATSLESFYYERSTARSVVRRLLKSFVDWENLDDVGRLATTHRETALPYTVVESLCFFKSLRHVDLCTSDDLPEAIGSLTTMQSLSLTSTTEFLPPSIGMLSNLTSLQLHCPLLNSLPPSTTQLRSLVELVVRSALLESLPSSLEGLLSLRKLVLNAPGLCSSLGDVLAIPRLAELQLKECVSLAVEASQVKALLSSLECLVVEGLTQDLDVLIPEPREMPNLCHVAIQGCPRLRMWQGAAAGARRLSSFPSMPEWVVVKVQESS